MMERNIASTATKSKFEQLKKVVASTDNLLSASRPISLQINTCQHHGKCCSGNCKLLEAPIILEKRTPKTTKHINKTKIDWQFTTGSPRIQQQQTYNSKTIRHHVEEFTPIDIPIKKAKDFGEYLIQPKTKQIEVRIEKDDTDKECLKKLFKKINKLTDQLNQSQKQRTRLQLQLDNYKNIQNRQKEYEGRIRDLELAKHKLDLELATLRELLAMQRLKPPQVIEKLVDRPVEVIRQVPVERIVEVQVEVAKMIPGPQRIIERFVEVPKYIEIEKKVPMQIVKEVVKEVPKEVVKTVQVPEYFEKPVYIEKPVYVDRVVEKKIEIPIQVPIETPIYIDRPISQPYRPDSSDYDYRGKFQRTSSLEGQLRGLAYDNDSLRNENRQLLRNLDILKKHNQDKNREVEHLIQNTHQHTMLAKGALGGYSFRPNTRSYNTYEEVRFRA